MKSPTNIFLASLALADLLLCIICLPVKVKKPLFFIVIVVAAAVVVVDDGVAEPVVVFTGKIMNIKTLILFLFFMIMVPLS